MALTLSTGQLTKSPVEYFGSGRTDRGLAVSTVRVRAAKKKSGSSPNEVDTSLVNSQLIYFQQEIELLHLNYKGVN